MYAESKRDAIEFKKLFFIDTVLEVILFGVAD